MTDLNPLNPLTSSWIDTPIGKMLAISDEDTLHLLEFHDRRGLEPEIERLCKRSKSTIVPGSTSPILSIKKELQAYFDGNLTSFKTPIHLNGTVFQKDVWATLMQIPYGETISYGTQAATLGKPTAARAVANANGANSFAILIPCHRIVGSNNQLGGYAGGIHRKQWLLDHEQKTLCTRKQRDDQ